LESGFSADKANFTQPRFNGLVNWQRDDSITDSPQLTRPLLYQRLFHIQQQKVFVFLFCIISYLFTRITMRVFYLFVLLALVHSACADVARFQLFPPSFTLLLFVL
jgi:hypothetical protein